MKVVRKPGPGSEKLARALQALKTDKVGKVGWLKSAQYEDGTSVAAVAITNEYGDPSRGIPPRPFMRPTIQEKKDQWKSLVKAQAFRILAGEATAESAMETVVLKASGDVRRAITKLKDPPLSQVTILARKYKKKGGVVTAKVINDIRKAIKKGPESKSDKSLSTVGVSTKPLIDTGIMLQTCVGIVESKST